jgi:hypothetical protein
MPVMSAISRTLTLRASLIKPSTMTIIISVQGLQSASVFLLIVIQCRSAIFNFVAAHNNLGATWKK